MSKTLAIYLSKRAWKYFWRTVPLELLYLYSPVRSFNELHHCYLFVFFCPIQRGALLNHVKIPLKIITFTAWLFFCSNWSNWDPIHSARLFVPFWCIEWVDLLHRDLFLRLASIQWLVNTCELFCKLCLEPNSNRVFVLPFIFPGSSRESTPCSLIRKPESIRTPSSSTKASSTTDDRIQLQNSSATDVPTAREVDDFFNCAEGEQQRKFIEK